MLECGAERSALDASLKRRHSSSRHCLEFPEFKDLTAESHEQTNKILKHHLRIRFRTTSLFRFALKRHLFWRPDENLKLGMGFA